MINRAVLSVTYYCDPRTHIYDCVAHCWKKLGPPCIKDGTECMSGLLIVKNGVSKFRSLVLINSFHVKMKHEPNDTEK